MVPSPGLNDAETAVFGGLLGESPEEFRQVTVDLAGPLSVVWDLLTHQQQLGSDTGQTYTPIAFHWFVGVPPH